MTRWIRLSARLQRGVMTVALVFFGTVALSRLASAQEGTSVESLIEANPVLFISADGIEQHREAYEQTAAYKAFYGSGLVDSLFELVDQFGEQGLLAKQVSRHLLDNGGTLAVNLPKAGQFPIPRVTVVLPGAAQYSDQLKVLISDLVKQSTPPIEPEEIEIGGRTVFRFESPEPPIVEFGLWTEGDHLVIAGGIGAVQSTINVAEGKVDDVTTSRCWQEYIAPAMAEGPIVSRCWLDFEQIRSNFGEIPIPTPDQQSFITINQFLEVIGLHEFRAAVMFSSLAADETVQSVVIEVPSPATGIMTLWDPAPLDLEQEFILPPNVMIFGANSMNFSRIYDAGWDIAEDLMARFNPQDLDEFNELKQAVPQIVGFDPKADLIDCLGRGTYISVAADSGLFSVPTIIVRQKVEDEVTLASTLNMLAERAAPLLEESEGMISIRRTELEGKPVVSVSIMGMITPSFVISDGWLMIGSSMQAIRSYWLREQGELSVFEPDERTASRLKNLPEGTISYGISDPTFSYQQMMSIGPMYIGMGQQMAIKEGLLPPDAPLPNLPPTELITKHIKPNFTVVWRDEDRLYAEVYSSVPEFTTGIAAGGVLVALLLPAVQSAREAARRAQYGDDVPLEYPIGKEPAEFEEVQEALEKPKPKPEPRKRPALPLPAPEK